MEKKIAYNSPLEYRCENLNEMIAYNGEGDTHYSQMPTGISPGR